ncbi:helix-turn-helix transcriptional regulator [Pseudonocardia adelaidensis]|uniref:helix-turn-helix transcriptional regulator n=1 Tax=Pseudonocardia adelaidensis TaxID=648754 RepID=UPI003CD0C00E
MLERHAICEHAPFERFRSELNALFYPARVEPLGRAPAGTGLLRGVRTEHLTVGLMRFGQPTLVDPGRTGAYHVNVTLAGPIASASDDEETVSTAGHATVFAPHRTHRLTHCAEGAAQLGIRVDRALLDGELEALLGRPVRAPVEFALEFDLGSPAGRAWSASLELLLSELDDPDGPIGRPAVRAYHERLLATGLLLAQRHSYTEALRDGALRGGAAPATPRAVRRVLDVVQGRPQEPYTIADLARVAGVSARRLQEAFREHVGSTPMEYLRSVRLDRVHEELRAGAVGVTETAYRWGFTHPGRFARAYRQRFGVLPSETARTSAPW